MKKFMLLIIFIILFYVLMPHIVVKSNIVFLSVHENFEIPRYNLKIFLMNSNNKVNIKNNVNKDKIGTYYVFYRYLFSFNIVKVKVIDNSSPTIEFCGPKNINLYDNKDYSKFYIHDNYYNDVSLKKKKYKDKIVYYLKDRSGNKNTITRKIINKDNLAPNILAPNNIFIKEGESIPKFNAIDNSNDKIDVFSSDIDTKKPGKYILDLIAEDKSHNRTLKRVNVNVLKRLVPGIIYLTFDDGPSDTVTPHILDILQSENVPATFFVTCHGSDSLIKREYDLGDSIGLHTASHIYSQVYGSRKAYFDDLYSVRDRVKNVTGNDSKIIRFPGGSSNTVSRKYSPGIMSYLTHEVEDRGFRYYDWNIDSGDAEGKSSDYIYNHVTSSLRKDRPNIVLMHDIKVNTMNALPKIIKYAKDNGYTFSKITDLDAEVKQRIYN